MQEKSAPESMFTGNIDNKEELVVNKMSTDCFSIKSKKWKLCLLSDQSVLCIMLACGTYKGYFQPEK